jgi:hypothetical protein
MRVRANSPRGRLAWWSNNGPGNSATPTCVEQGDSRTVPGCVKEDSAVAELCWPRSGQQDLGAGRRVQDEGMAGMPKITQKCLDRWGIASAPDDSPIYQHGPTVSFVPPRPKDQDAQPSVPPSDESTSEQVGADRSTM